MPKCDFNKVAKQFFQNTFSYEHPGWLLLIEVTKLLNLALCEIYQMRVFSDVYFPT